MLPPSLPFLRDRALLPPRYPACPALRVRSFLPAPAEAACKRFPRPDGAATSTYKFASIYWLPLSLLTCTIAAWGLWWVVCMHRGRDPRGSQCVHRPYGAGRCCLPVSGPRVCPPHQLLRAGNQRAVFHLHEAICLLPCDRGLGRSCRRCKVQWRVGGEHPGNRDHSPSCCWAGIPRWDAVQ